MDEANGYKCQCTSGYTGVACDTGKKEFVSSVSQRSADTNEGEEMFQSELYTISQLTISSLLFTAHCAFRNGGMCVTSLWKWWHML